MFSPGRLAIFAALAPTFAAGRRQRTGPDSAYLAEGEGHLELA
jgi:hypothetical protein